MKGKIKMKRKLIAIVLAVALVFSVACVGAYADNGGAKRMTLAQKLCYVAAELAVDSCNKLVEAAVRYAQATPKNDVAELIATTDYLLRDTVIVVNALGFQVECCYTEYTVDGQTVLIDPLRVINPIGTEKK